MKKNKKGLTLIELLAVIAIIAILFVLLIPQVNSAFDKSREAGVMTDFNSLKISFESYFNHSQNKKITEENLNDWLSGDLKIEKGNTLKKSPYDMKYRVFIEGDNQINVRIYTQKNNKKIVKGLVVSYSEGAVKTRTYGFENNIGVTKKGVYENFDYEVLWGSEVVIKKYNGLNKDIIIPNEIEGLPVTIIENSTNGAEGSFNNQKIKSIKLPNKLKHIGEYSFYNNEIEELELPKTLEHVGQGAFYKSKIGSIELRESIIYIGPSAFRSNNLTEVIIPDNVQIVGNGAFAGNPLIKYTISNNTEYNSDDEGALLTFPISAIRQ